MGRTNRRDRELDRGLRICANCKESKKTKEFGFRISRGRRAYVQSYCKTCRRKGNVSNSRKSKKLAVEYLGGKCSECGYIGCAAVYDFHHVNPEDKEFSIGSRSHKNFESIKEELDKCVLLCSNCHRTLHYYE